MERQMTIGRTTFLVRRPSAAEPAADSKAAKASFIKAWMHVYCGVWEVKSTAGKAPVVPSREQHHEPE